MSQSATKWKVATGVMVGTVLVVTIALGLVYVNQQVGSHGKVKTINCAVFADAGATQPLTDIDWGTLEPGAGVNWTIYIKNTGNVPANFTYAVGSWNPANAGNYITITADFLANDKNVAQGKIFPCILTLQVSPNIVDITDFSNVITITASG